MPLIIDPKNATSTAFARPGPTRPDYGFSNARYEDIGSKDNWFVERDYLFNPYVSQSSQRYTNGTWWDSLGNFAAQVGVKGVGGIALGVASVAETSSLLLPDLLRGISPLDRMNEGIFGTLNKGLTQLTDDYLPLFTPEGFSDKNFGQKLLQPAQLAKEGVDSVAFLAQSIGIAGVASKLNAGARAVNALYKTRPLLAQIAGELPKDLASKAGRINALVSNELLALTESAAEGKETGENLRKKLIQDRLDGKNNLTDSEVEDRVNMAENNVMALNMITNSLTNIPFTRLASPLINKGVTSTANEYAVRMLGNKFAAKTYNTKFEKLLFDKGYVPGQVTKSLLGQVVSEGLEESLQYSIQKVNEASNKATTFADAATQYAKEIYTGKVVSEIFTDKERGNAAGLGALFGSITPIALSPFTGTAASRAREFSKSQAEYIKSLNESYTNAVSTSLYKKNPATTNTLSTEVDDTGISKYYQETNGVKSEIDFDTYDTLTDTYDLPKATGGTFTTPSSLQLSEDGFPIIDPEKQHKFFEDASTHLQLEDFINQEIVRGESSDPTILSLARAKSLDTLARTAAQGGVSDLLFERFEILEKTAEEEFEGLGYASASDLRKSAASDLEYLKRATNLYENIEKDIIPSSLADVSKNNLRKKRLYNLATSANHMRQLSLELNSETLALANNLTEKYIPEDRENVSKVLKKLTQIDKWKSELDTLLSEKDNFILTNQREMLQRVETKSADLARKIESEVTSLQAENATMYEQLAENSEVQQLVDKTTKREYLEEQIKENDRIYNEIADSYKGLAKFDSYTKGKDKSFQLVQEKSPSTLSLTDATTLEQYKHYEERALVKKRFEQKLRSTGEAFYTELISDLTNLLSTSSTKDSLIVIRQFVETIIEKKPYLSDETIDVLKDLAKDALAPVNESYSFLQESLNELLAIELNSKSEIPSIEEDLRDKLDEVEDPELLRRYTEALRHIDAYKDIESEVGILGTDLKVLDDLSIDTPFTKTDNDLKLEIAREQLKGADNVITASGFPTVSPEYTDLASVQVEIKKVTKLKEFFNSLKYYTHAPDYLDYLLEIEEEVKKNLANKETTNIKQNLEYAQGVIRALGAVDFKNSSLFNDLKAKFTSEQLDILSTVLQTNPVLGANMLMDAVTILAPSYIVDLKVKKLNQFKEFVSKLPTGLKKVDEAVIPTILSSPTRGFRTILQTLEFNFKSQAIGAFNKRYSVVEFREAIKSDTSSLSKEQLTYLIDSYLEFEALYALSASKPSFRDLASKFMQASNEKKRPSPSSSQERVVNQLVRFFSSPFSTDLQAYRNTAVLKAPAGAGKSLIVIPYFLKLAGLNPTQVLTAAPKAPASKLIAASTSSSYGPNLLNQLTEDLKNSKIDKDVKVIIVDEAASASYTETHALVGELNAYMERNQNHQIKLVFVYDPNQVSKAKTGRPLIDSITYSLPYNLANLSPEEKRKATLGLTPPRGTELPFIQNIFDLSPLNVTYRSDVGDIVNVQNQFLSSTVPTKLIGASSIDPLGIHTTPILGFFGEISNGSLLQILTNSHKQSPERSRAIIVDTDAKKAKYEVDTKHLGVAVYTVEESSGVTVDEAYVDVDPNSLGASPEYANQFMYTATSRASKFLYVSHFNASNSVDSTIPSKAETNAKFKVSRNEEFNKEKEAELELYEKIFGENKNSKAPKPEPKKNEKKDESNTEDEAKKAELERKIAEAEAEANKPVVNEELEDNKKEAEEITEEEESEDTDIILGGTNEPIESEDIHILKFPQNSVFKEIKDISGEAVLVHHLYEGKPTFSILKAVDRGFQTIGILSNTEIDNVSKVLGKDITTLVPTKVTKRTGAKRGFVQVDSLGNANSLPIFISSGSSPLTFEFSPTPTASFTSENEAKSFVDSMLRKMYGDNYKAEINADEILSNFNDFVKFRIYMTDEEIGNDTIGSDYRPKKGRPYMVLTGLKYRSQNVNTPNVFIPLSPSLFNKNSQLAKYIGLPSVFTLLQKVKEFEEMVQSSNWPSAAYKSMALGVPFVLRANQVYYPFHQFVNTLSEIHHSRVSKEKNKEIKFASDAYNAMAKKYAPAFELPAFDSSLPSDELVKLASEIDELIHGARKPFDVLDPATNQVTGTKRPRRAYRGEAQLAMDSISKSNFVVTLNNGKNKILRDVRNYFIYESGENVSNYSGVSLLGPLKFEHSGGKSFNALIPPKIVAKASQFLTSLEARGLGESSRADFLRKIVNGDPTKDHLSPFTLKDFEALFSTDVNGNFSNVSEGFGLRNPLPLYTWNALSTITPPYENTVETNVNNIRPTTIGISKVPTSIEIPEQIPAPEVDKTLLNSAKIKIRKVVEENRPFTMSDLTSDELMSISDPLEYYENLKYETGIYQTISSNFLTTLKTVKESIGTSMDVALTYALQVSPSIIRNSDKASRDFIKASLLTALSPSSDPLVIARLATMDVKQDGEAIMEYEEVLFNSLEADADAIEAINVSLRKIASENKLEFNPPQVEEDGMGIFNYLNYVAKDFSSRYRALGTSDAATLPNTEEILAAVDQIKSMEEKLQRLVELYDEDGDAKEFEEIAKEVGLNITIDDDDVLKSIQDLRDEVSGARDMLVVDYLSDDVGQPLTDEEAINLNERLIPTSVIQRLLRIFKKGKGEQFRIVDFAYMQSLGKNNWGLYKNGVITVVRDSKGNIGSKVVRHEAFHKVFNEYLFPAEKALAFKVASEESGLTDILQLEEYMADKFASFARGSKTVWDYLSSIFAKILRLFNFTYNNISSLEDFFTHIEDGHYSKKLNTPVLERDLVVRGNWPSADHFSIAKNIVMETFSKIYLSRDGDTVFSFDEALGETQRLISEYVTDVRKNFPNSDEVLIREALTPLADKTSNAYKAFYKEYFSAAKATVAAGQEKSLLAKEFRKKAELLDAYRSAEEVQDLEDDLATIEYVNADGEIEEYSVEELEENISNLANELHDNEVIDPKTKLTGRVKQRMITVKYGKPGNVKTAEFDSVFDVLLDLLPQSSYTSLKELISSIDQRIRILTTGKLTAGLQPNIRLATCDFVATQLENLQNLLDTRSDISFSKDINYAHEYVVIGNNARGLSYSEAISKGYIVETKSVDPTSGLAETTDDFITRVSTSHNIPKEDLRNAFYLYEDLSFFTSLTSALVSLRENNPYVGIEQWKDFKYKLSYWPVRMAGARAVLESDIRRAFAKTYEDSPGFITKDMIQKLDAAALLNGEEGIKAKLKRINLFINTIGLAARSVDRSVSDSQIEELFNSLTASLKEMRSATFTEEDLLEYPGLTAHSGTTLLLNQGSLVTKLVEAMGAASSAVRSPSYIRGDGKKAYRFIDASFQSATLNYLAKMVSDAREISGFAPSHIKVLNKKLSTTSPFLANNPFITGSCRILKYVSHDSTKRKGADQYATYLHSEGRLDYYKRTFALGFLAGIKQHSKKGSPYYFQFLPIPSNRRSIDSVLVTAQNMDGIKASINAIITAERQRKDPSSDPYLAGEANYKKRWNKFHFPGLEGISIKDPRTTKELTELALQNLKKRSATEALEYMELLSAGSSNPDILTNRIDTEAIQKTASALEISTKDYISRETFNKTRAQMRTKLEKGEVTPEQIEAFEIKYRENTASVITSVFENFYLNSAINQYSLSQIIYGDESFFKSKEDETKRIQVATATGDVSLIDDTFGYPSKSTVGIIRDIQPFVPTDLEGVREEAYKQDYTLSDGQGYMLPEAYEKFAKSRGVDAETDVTLKPVYYGQDSQGRPIALKYSLIVLTDQLVSEYPHLGKLRAAMRNYNATRGDSPEMHQAVFESAVKLGKRVNSSGEVDTYVDDFGNITHKGGLGFSPNSLLTIENKYLRTQLNPSKKVEVTVANPSQGTAFMNTNGLNPTESALLYRLNQILLDTGDIKHSRENAITPKGTLSSTSKRRLRESITNQGDIPGLEDVVRLLGLKDVAGRYMVSMNLPIIAQKAIATLASNLSSATVGFRFPGSKLVLQSEYGTYSAESEMLKWKDEDGFTEVLLPEEYRNFFSEGDTVTNGLVGFRIPSSNYHSLLALKVKGFYKVPPGSKGNVVIAPSLIVYYHGSDYDIDTLFVIKKEKFKTPFKIDIGDIISKYGLTPYADLTFDNGEYLGFKSPEGDKINGVPVYEVMSSLVEELSRKIQSYTTSLSQISRLESERRKEMYELLKTANADLSQLITLTQSMVKNTIVDTFAKNIKAPKNRKDLLTPISFARVSNLRSDMKKALESESLEDDFITELENAGLLIKC